MSILEGFHAGLISALIMPLIWIPGWFLLPKTPQNTPDMTLVYLSDADSAGCCYTLAFDYDPSDGFYNGVEVSLVDPQVAFSAIHFNLADGWQHSIPVPDHRLRWTRPTGTIPTGGYELFDFCINGWHSNIPLRMAVNWLANNAIVGTDTLEFACQNCAAVLTDSVVCQVDSGLLYQFQFVNHTGFTVHRLRIREAPAQDYIAEDYIPMNPPLAPGATASGLTLHLGAALTGQQQYCFEITPSRLLNDNTPLDCCTIDHCIDIPICDHCCTEYSDFVADVEARYTYDLSCMDESVTFFAAQLSECDQVQWRIRNINGGPTIAGTLTGDVPFMYQFVDHGPFRVCMRVTRRDLSGQACYAPDQATLEVCDTLVVDCPCVDTTQINWDFECTSFFNPVCGCDSMTYINSCAAENWAGLFQWTAGPCTMAMAPMDTIALTVTAGIGGAQLDWTTTGSIDYRYFLVQRRVPPAGFLTVGLAQGDVLTWLDPSAPPGLSIYRIVGVTFPGKPVFSNEVSYLMTGESQVYAVAAVYLWPNPTSGMAYLGFTSTLSGTVITYNADGRKIFEQTFQNVQQVELNVSEWPPGLYILRALTPHGEAWTGKLLVGF